MSDYVRFYRGECTTVIDRLSIFDVLNLDDTGMEHKHGYVQWTFPMKCLSKNQVRAATQVLTDEAIGEMMNDDVIMYRIDQMAGKMLDFWGIRWQYRTEGLVFVHSRKRFETKLVKTNHNQLRMTRLLVFLSCVGRTVLVRNLKELLLENVPAACSSRRYWQSAGT